MSEQASERNGLVDVGLPFMTYAQSPETMKPSKSPLNEPTLSTEPFA